MSNYLSLFSKIKKMKEKNKKKRGVTSKPSHTCRVRDSFPLPFPLSSFSPKVSRTSSASAPVSGPLLRRPRTSLLGSRTRPPPWLRRLRNSRLRRESRRLSSPTPSYILLPLLPVRLCLAYSRFVAVFVFSVSVVHCIDFWGQEVRKIKRDWCLDLVLQVSFWGRIGVVGRDLWRIFFLIQFRFYFVFVTGL